MLLYWDLAYTVDEVTICIMFQRVQWRESDNFYVIQRALSDGRTFACIKANSVPFHNAIICYDTYESCNFKTFCYSILCTQSTRISGQVLFLRFKLLVCCIFFCFSSKLAYGCIPDFLFYINPLCQSSVYTCMTHLVVLYSVV